MERNDELKEIHFKNCTCYYFDEIMQVGDFNFDDNLLNKISNEISYKNVLVYGISYKTFMGAKPLRIRLDQLDVLKFLMELNILHCLVLEDMIQFMVELDIL